MKTIWTLTAPVLFFVVIGAGSAPFAQPLGQIAGALLAGNGVAFKPAARACLAGERIGRVLARETSAQDGGTSTAVRRVLSSSSRSR